MLSFNLLRGVRRSPKTSKRPPTRRSRSCPLNLEVLEQRLVLDGNSGFPTNGFFQLIDKVNAGQLLGLAANGIQVGEFLAGLFAQDPAAKIIDRIDLLQKDIDQQFQDLGSLLNTEIQNVIANEDKLANQEAVAHAVTAERDLYDYKLTRDQTWLAFAGNESSLATAFLEQQTDPFYIGGLVSAGNARIDFFRALEPDWAHDPAAVGEVNELINSLAGMISTVQQTLESNHTIVETGFKPHSGPTQLVFSHFDKGVEMSRFRSEGAAEQARLAGIGNERTFLSIPEFEQILHIWEDLRGTLVLAAPKQITAQAPFDFTITARDASGNIDANYRGTVALTTSDPSGRIPPVYTFTANDKGVHRFTAGAALVTVGSQTITASDTVSAISASAEVVVKPRSRFGFVPPPQLITGGPSAPAPAALDRSGNIDSNYRGTVALTSSDPGGQLPATMAQFAANPQRSDPYKDFKFRTVVQQSGVEPTTPSHGSAHKKHVDDFFVVNLRDVLITT